MCQSWTRQYVVVLFAAAMYGGEGEGGGGGDGEVAVSQVLLGDGDGAGGNDATTDPERVRDSQATTTTNTRSRIQERLEPAGSEHNGNRVIASTCLGAPEGLKN